jgi:flagellar basal body-associated protein FliL
MKLCPVCKSNFIEVTSEQIFCGGDHCDRQSVTPRKKFLISRKIPIILSVVLIAIAAVVLSSQVGQNRGNQQIATEINEEEQDSTQELDALTSTAGKYVAELEENYCLLLLDIRTDDEVKLALTQNSDDYDAMNQALESYQNEADEIYNSYAGLKSKLGSEASNFSSPVLDAHVDTWNPDSWGWDENNNESIWGKTYSSLCSE